MQSSTDGDNDIDSICLDNAEISIKRLSQAEAISEQVSVYSACLAPLMGRET